MDTTYQNNKLIRKSILSMFGGSLAAMITVSIAMMTDTILAGALFENGQIAIAAVAIGMPIINIFQALNQTIINGASIRMNISAGKGDEEDVQRSFSVGLFFTIVCGLIFIALCLLFAEGLVKKFGASEGEVFQYALWYLRGAAGCIVCGVMNMFMSKILALYGEQKVILHSSLLAVIANIALSTILVKVLPDGIKIAGLGIATAVSGLMAAFVSYMALRKHGLHFRIKLKDINFSILKGFVVNGLPSSGNALADGVVSGVVNNIIVGSMGVVALAVFTAVKSITTFATAIVMAINLSVMPLFGIMYGSRDKNGIIRAFTESMRIALIAILICAVVVCACSPLLANVFDMRGNTDFYIGLTIGMFAFLPLTAFVRIIAQLFESMENPMMGLLYSAIPDSIIFPVLLILLVGMGYIGIWISYSLNAIPFLLGLFALRSIKSKTLGLSYDRLFCLDDEIKDNVPMIDISINSDNKDVSFISEKVYSFLSGEGVGHKIAHTTALCLEELSADFVAHSDTEKTEKSHDVIMDIKLFSDEDKLRTIIRNESSQYNPLDFELDTQSFSKMGVKLAQKLASNVQYSYVYKMNIITIDINK